MSATFTGDIASITRRNNRYVNGWFLTVINEQGEWVSKQGVWFASKAEAITAMNEQHPGAKVMTAKAFKEEWLRRDYHGDHS
jgi:hypothetical protein